MDIRVTRRVTTCDQLTLKYMGLLILNSSVAILSIALIDTNYCYIYGLRRVLVRISGHLWPETYGPSWPARLVNVKKLYPK